MLSAPSPEMTSLLKSVLINTDNGSIKWEKLEQFISIASNAEQAMSGNFQALKKAQDRSDIAKLYSGKKQETNVTFDVTIQIFDFLISENGKFLFDPLIDEIVETIEALGISALSLSSLLTSGLIPPPNEKPSREKVELFFKLMGTILERADARTPVQTPKKDLKNIVPYTFDRVQNQGSGQGSGQGGVEGEINPNTGIIDNIDINTNNNNAINNNNNNNNNNNQDNNIGRTITNVLEQSATRLNVLRTIISFFNNLFKLPQDRIVQLQPIINRSSVLVRAVVSKLLERGARRVVRRVVSPTSVTATLPTLGRLVDLILPIIAPRKTK